MSDAVILSFDVTDNDYEMMGSASGEIKKKLKSMNIPADAIRRVAIAMYEAEVNMVIHANGGRIDVIITESDITVTLADNGPGIPDIAWAAQEGCSTADDDIRALGFGAGMGIPNMKKYTDYFDIKSQVGVGTTVTMKINL